MVRHRARAFLFCVTALLFVSGALPQTLSHDHCHGLRLFRERNPEAALPIMIEALQEFQSSVTANHIGAVYNMAARRLAASNPPRVDEEQVALAAAVRFFRIGARARHTVKKNRATLKSKRYSCLKNFKQPLAQVLRSWGDMLLWLGREQEAQSVFRSKEAKKLWPNPLCRPGIIHPVERRPLSNLPYIFDQGNLPNSNVFTVTRSLLLPIIKQKNKLMESGSSKFWRAQSAGLHYGHTWETLLIWADRGASGVCSGEIRNAEWFVKVCEVVRTLVASTKELQVSKGQIKLSRMYPGTHVRAHAGPTNERFRMHCSIDMPLLVPASSFIRVGDMKRTWGPEGSCFAFRESCEHEVFLSESLPRPRTVLIVDFANPFLREYTSNVASAIEL